MVLKRFHALGQTLLNIITVCIQLESTVMVCGAPTQEYIDEYFSNAGKVYLQGVVKKHQDAGSSLGKHKRQQLFISVSNLSQFYMDVF